MPIPPSLDSNPDRLALVYAELEAVVADLARRLRRIEELLDV